MTGMRIVGVKLRSGQKLLWLSFLVVVLLTSCTRKINFSNSTVVPAARGTVEIKKDRNNNYSIDIDIKHLAEPDRLPRPRKLYVVWIESAENGLQNIGELKPSTGLLTGSLRASMKAISPFKPTRVIITAEDRANIQSPGNYVVLNTVPF
jgi:hypothetical protein